MDIGIWERKTMIGIEIAIAELEERKMGTKELSARKDIDTEIAMLEGKIQEIKDELISDLMARHNLKKNTMYFSKHYAATIFVEHYGLREKDSFTKYCKEYNLPAEKALDMGMVPFEVVAYGYKLPESEKVDRRNLKQYKISDFKLVKGENNV